MGLGQLVGGVVGFLRAGYPRQAPAVGYAPALALLPRRTPDDDIATVARILAPQGITRSARIDAAEIGAQIVRIADELPAPGDVERVLAAMSRHTRCRSTTNGR